MIEFNEFNAQVEIGSKTAKQDLPTQNYLSHIKGTIKTGKLTTLGLPLQMQLALSNQAIPEWDNLKNSPTTQTYIIEGQGFATIGDIKIKDGELDKNYDSFRTISLIAKKFLENSIHTAPFTSHHTMFSKNNSIGVEALQVFSYQGKGKALKLVRVHLLKQADGWKVENLLEPWKLLDSRIEGSKKSSDELKVITSQKIESLLKNEQLNNHLYTTISCRQSKDKTQGLCSAKITVLQNEEKSCLTKAYSLKKDSAWALVKEVSPELTLEYKTGKLIPKKKKAPSLKEALLNKAIELVFKKCTLF